MCGSRPVLLFVAVSLAAITTFAQETVVGIECQCPGQRITHHPPGTDCMSVCGISPPSESTSSSSTSTTTPTTLSPNAQMVSILGNGLIDIMRAYQVDSQRRAAEKQRRLEQQQAVQKRIRAFRAAEQQRFEASKRETLSMMKGSAPTYMGLKSITNAQSDERSRIASVTPRIRDRLSILLAGFDTTSAVRIEEPTETAYFYDLQMRRTMPRVSDPLGDRGQLASAYGTWQSAQPQIDLKGDTFQRINALRHAASDRVVEFAREQTLDVIIDHIEKVVPGVVSNLKGFLNSYQPVIQASVEQGLDPLARTAWISAYGSPADANVALSQQSAGLQTIKDTADEAAHGAVLDAIASKVWVDDTRQAITDDAKERFQFAFPNATSWWNVDD